MLLDLNQSDQQLWARPKPNEGARLPATFEEGFGAAWNESRLFSASSASGAAQVQALEDYVAEVKRRAGTDLTQAASQIGIGGDFSKVNEEVAKLNAGNPDLKLPDLSLDELDRRAAILSRQARQAYQQQAAGEGGGFGRFVGGLAGAATDPLNLVLAPFGGGEAGVLVTALKFGGLAAAAQAGNEALQSEFRERVQPGYGASGEPGANILEAAASGAVLGGGLKALGNVWTRAKTGTWPTTVRDAGNVIESEAHLQSTNVLPGAEGEIAHREAMAKSIDQILNGEPIDPGTMEASRALVARLEQQAPFTLPVMNERAIRLLSEEVGLHARAGELNQRIAGLPEGDVSAADRLNRLAQVEQQMATASPAERQALQERRDQILVDTTPDALRAAAAPTAARQAAEAERAAVQGRLADIATERARLEQETPPVSVGQRQMVPRTLFDIHADRIERLMDARGAAGQVAEQARQERLAAQTEPATLPFLASEKEAEVEARVGAMAHGIEQLALLSGHEMPRDQSLGLAQRVVGAATDAEARFILNQVTDRPITLLDTLPPSSTFTAAVREAEKAAAPILPHEPAETAKMLASPDHEAALRSDIDRARTTGDVQIPAGVDAEGNPMFRSLDSALDEVDSFKKAADEIQACAAPMQQAAE